MSVVVLPPSLLWRLISVFFLEFNNTPRHHKSTRMGKSSRSKKMKRKRTEKRAKLDNWERKNVETLYKKVQEIIQTPAASTEMADKGLLASPKMTLP